MVVLILSGAAPRREARLAELRRRLAANAATQAERLDRACREPGAEPGAGARPSLPPSAWPAAWLDALPDVRGADAALFAPPEGGSRSVVLVGCGYSAATTLLALLELAAAHPHGRLSID